MGLSTAAPPAPAGGAGNAGGNYNGSTSGRSTSSTENPRQALRKFMHDLFAAVKSESNSTGGGTSTPATAASSYSSLSGKIEGLIKSWGPIPPLPPPALRTAPSARCNRTITTWFQRSGGLRATAHQTARTVHPAARKAPQPALTARPTAAQPSRLSSKTCLQTSAPPRPTSSTGNFMNLYW